MRKIEKKMIEYIDKRLALNGAAQNAISKKDARSLFIYAAESLVGIREKGGNNKGPMVELIQETIGNASGEAWCMSFVQTCLAYAEVKTGVTSPIVASETCTHVWDTSPKKQRVKIAPLPGAIIIWQRKGSWQGHTGIVTEFKGKTFEAVEGNTESGVANGEVMRDGGGVYITERTLKGYGIMKLLGFLKPF